MDAVVAETVCLRIPLQNMGAIDWKIWQTCQLFMRSSDTWKSWGQDFIYNLHIQSYSAQGRLGWRYPGMGHLQCCERQADSSYHPDPPICPPTCVYSHICLGPLASNHITRSTCKILLHKYECRFYLALLCFLFPILHCWRYAPFLSYTVPPEKCLAWNSKGLLHQSLPDTRQRKQRFALNQKLQEECATKLSLIQNSYSFLK